MKRLLLFAALIAWSGMASAVVYKWIDAQGKVQYGDRPPDGVHAEVVELLVAHYAATRSRADACGRPRPQERRRSCAAQGLRRKNAVAQDVAQTRDKQCTDAQDRYKRLIEGPQALQDRP